MSKKRNTSHNSDWHKGNLKVNKDFTTGTNPDNIPLPLRNLTQDKNHRGLQVYTISQIINQTGRDERGRLINWGFQYPYFYL